MQTYAVVDHDLRILWVGGEWDEYALENKAPAAVANRVLSTRIDEHIVGHDTRDCVISLIRTVMETQNPLTMDYRGDSPLRLRRFQLTVKPMKADRVLLVHDLRESHTYPHSRSAWRYDNASPWAKCSFCCSLKGPEEHWIAPETVIDHPETVDYVVCSVCKGNITSAIEATRANRKAGKPVVNGFGPHP